MLVYNNDTYIMCCHLETKTTFKYKTNQQLCPRQRNFPHKLACNCFNAYLSSRTQRVNISGVLSDSKKLTFDVPHGSVLGPTLYCMYTNKFLTLFVDSSCLSLIC